MKRKYYFFYLEIALKKKNDLNIYAYENVSHIPAVKLIEIFKINIGKDPNLLEGYLLTKANYKRHKKYIDQNIGTLNLDIFEYCLRQYETEGKKEIRKLYKENLME